MAAFLRVLTGSPKAPGLPTVEPTAGPSASGTASPTISLGSASIEYYADAADQPVIAASPQRHPAVPMLDLPAAQHQHSGHDLAVAALLSRQSSPGKQGPPSLSTRSGASSLMSWNPGGLSKSYAGAITPPLGNLLRRLLLRLCIKLSRCSLPCSWTQILLSSNHEACWSRDWQRCWFLNTGDAHNMSHWLELIAGM